MAEFKEVSKAEFDSFINDYPHELETDVTGIFDPPVMTFNDFTDGKVWPESVVAKVKLYNNEPFYDHKPNVYLILED